MAMGHELGIIGAGNMAEAIARSVIGAGVVLQEEMVAAVRAACLDKAPRSTASRTSRGTRMPRPRNWWT